MARSALALLGLAGLMLTVAGCGSQPVPTVKSFANYNSSDGVFALDYPEGWQVESAVAKARSWANFTYDAAEIRVYASATASLMDDAEGGRSADRSAPLPELAPVHGVHEKGLDGASEDYGSYQETAAGTQVLDCRLGPARFSEFTGTAGVGRSIHGMRATVIGTKKGVHVVCTCNESDWSNLKPVFAHVLGSLKRGQEE